MSLRSGKEIVCQGFDALDSFNLLGFTGEQAQLFRLGVQAKISSEKIISSAWLFRAFILPTQVI